jgi:hypothetical protein
MRFHAFPHYPIADDIAADVRAAADANVPFAGQLPQNLQHFVFCEKGSLV